MQNLLFELIRDTYPEYQQIPLHAPIFSGNEKRNVAQCIDTTFVSSVGEFVSEFETKIAHYCGSAGAVATVNGTSALQAALVSAGVKQRDLVITQSLTFVATCNAIHWLGAEPVFIDVAKQTVGMCPNSLEEFLTEHCYLDQDRCIHRATGKKISAIVPMHTFGHPVEITKIVEIATKWNIKVVEDAAESLGSTFEGQACGSFGEFGAISFNGNKIITTGGGGMVLCNSVENTVKLRHLTTTAKVSHPYEFLHDDYGFNFRMPNINAALGCAQLENLSVLLEAKRKLASVYTAFFDGTDFSFVIEPSRAKSNYWLNAVICPTKEERDTLLNRSLETGIMLRPVWTPMHQLPIYQHCICGNLDTTEFLSERLINLPSTVPHDYLASSAPSNANL